MNSIRRLIYPTTRLESLRFARRIFEGALLILKGIIEPLFRYKEPLIDKRVPMLRCISGKDSYLAIIGFANCSTILPPDSGREKPEYWNQQ